MELKNYDLDYIKKLRHVHSDFLDFCYTAVHDTKDDYNELSKIAKELDTTVYEMRRAAWLYKREDKRYDYSFEDNFKEKSERFVKSGYDQKYGELTEKILKEDNVENIYKLIKDNGDDLKELFLRMTSYINNMYVKNSEEMLKLLEEKKQQVIAYKRQKRANEMIPKKEATKEIKKSQAMRLAKEILQDNDICYLWEIETKYDISKHNLQAYKTIWDEENVYDLIKAKINKNRLNSNFDYIDMIKKILPLTDKKSIKAGLLRRSFDLLDCYTYFGDSINNILELCRNNIDFPNDENLKVNRDRLGKLKNMLMVFASDSYSGLSGFNSNISPELEEHVKEKIYNEKWEVDHKELDKDGFIVLGSGHLLTKEEKNSVFNLMHDMRIPITSRTFELATKRFYDGEMHFITPDNIDEYINDTLDVKAHK